MEQIKQQPEPKCQHCKSIENLFVNSRKSDRKQFMCRKCNTERSKMYGKTKKGKENIYNAVYKSMKKLKYKQDARQKLHRATVSKKIIKQKVCELCKNSKNIQGHHPNYRFALKVIWVCRDCHCKIHKLKRKCQKDLMW